MLYHWTHSTDGGITTGRIGARPEVGTVEPPPLSDLPRTRRSPTTVWSANVVRPARPLVSTVTRVVTRVHHRQSHTVGVIPSRERAYQRSSRASAPGLVDDGRMNRGEAPCEPVDELWAVPMIRIERIPVRPDLEGDLTVDAQSDPILFDEAELRAVGEPGAWVRNLVDLDGALAPVARRVVGHAVTVGTRSPRCSEHVSVCVRESG